MHNEWRIIFLTVLCTCMCVCLLRTVQRTYHIELELNCWVVNALRGRYKLCIYNLHIRCDGCATIWLNNINNLCIFHIHSSLFDEKNHQNYINILVQKILNAHSEDWINKKISIYLYTMMEDMLTFKFYEILNKKYNEIYLVSYKFGGTFTNTHTLILASLYSLLVS